MRLLLRQSRVLLPRTSIQCNIHLHSTTSNPPPSAPIEPKGPEPSTLLSTPTWDPSTLLPSPSDISAASSHITPSQLRHLLRLSGLPPPDSQAEEQDLLATLGAQLHFVKKVTEAAASEEIAGLEPLRAVRDETSAAMREVEAQTADIARGVMAGEERRGKYWPRPRRRKDVDDKAAQPEEQWDVFANASKRVGRYFTVERSKA